MTKRFVLSIFRSLHVLIVFSMLLGLVPPPVAAAPLPEAAASGSAEPGMAPSDLPVFAEDETSVANDDGWSWRGSNPSSWYQRGIDKGKSAV